MKNCLKLILAVLFVSFSVTLSAEIKLPKVIGDNMVLQQGKPVHIWGYATGGSNVTVKFGKQTVKARAAADGKWMLDLAPLTASAVPGEMTIEDSKSRVVLKNILIGEVWLGSGQSNMEYTMKLPSSYKKPYKGEDYQALALANDRDPLLRIFYVQKKLDTPDLPTNGWQMLSEESLSPFSAPAYFFAKELREKLGVPVGIIATSWGGTAIEVWTPAQAYIESPLFSKDIGNGVLDQVRVGDRYRKMVEPIIPFAIKGFIWYQGETNLMQGDTLRYTEKQKVLVDYWRAMWGDDKMPFYYVQISPYLYSQRRADRVVNNWQALAYFWEAQTLAMNIPYSGMVVTTDLVDDIRDIHPSYKWTVGKRLALWALAKDYGKEVVYSGPQYKSFSINGGKITVEFDHTGSGLVSTDGKALTYFELAGADGKFRKADAVIDGNTVVVSGGGVSNPVNVRFAWDEAAMPNLANKEGLPALPFRSNGAKWEYNK